MILISFIEIFIEMRAMNISSAGWLFSWLGSRKGIWPAKNL